MQQQPQYDVIIIGGSYAGLSAAMALGRALRQVLVIDGEQPCNRQTPHSHNFLTNDGKAPAEIAKQARAQVAVYSSVSFKSGLVITAATTPAGFIVRLQTGEEFTSVKLVLASGIKDLMPDISGFAESWGISVLHCPYCHGYEVRYQPTGILANGDAAYELGMLLSNWTNSLTIFTNGPVTLTSVQIEKLQSHQIAINERSILRLDHDKGQISQLVFQDGTREPLAALYARLPFEQSSSVPEQLGCALNPEGYIQVDAAQRTTVPGVYACGDNTTRVRTVANAVAMGTTTGLMLNREWIEERF